MKREYSLDILKLVAIVIIVLHHYQQVSHAHFERGINWSGGEFYWGYLVELFFIISGLLSFHHIKNVANNNATFSRFFLGKYLRFLPMLVICGVVYIAIRVFYIETIGSEQFDASIWNIWNVVASLLGVARWLSSTLMINNPMWYVSVLLLCYVLFYACACLSKMLKSFSLAPFFILMFYGIFMRHVCTEYQFEAPFFNLSIARGLLCFFEGVLFAELLSKYPLYKNRRIVLIAALGLVAFILCYAIRPQLILGSNVNNASDSPLIYTICFIVYPALILIFKSDLAHSIFSSRRLASIGTIAFSMYVWHAALIYLFLILLNVLNLNAQSQVAMYSFLCFCGLTGYLSSRFLEKPLSAKITAWLASKS